MNETVNRLLLTGHKFISDIYLQQLTLSAAGMKPEIVGIFIETS